MNAVEVKMKSQFVDQVWCSIKLKSGEDLLIGICYRSPNPEFSDKENDNICFAIWLLNYMGNRCC